MTCKKARTYASTVSMDMQISDLNSWNHSCIMARGEKQDNQFNSEDHDYGF